MKEKIEGGLMPEIVFVRNARREDNKDTLSQEGETKCLRAGAILQELGFWPDLVVTSDDPRSLRTGELIAQGLEMQPQFAVIPGLQYLAPDLSTYYAHVAPVFVPIFEELGIESPIAEYLERDTARIFLNCAEEVVEEILAEARKVHGTRKVLIVGHHIIQNLVGIAYAGRDPILLGPHFAPLTGYWIHEDKSVTDVKLID